MFFNDRSFKISNQKTSGDEKLNVWVSQYSHLEYSGIKSVLEHVAASGNESTCAELKGNVADLVRV